MAQVRKTVTQCYFCSEYRSHIVTCIRCNKDCCLLHSKEYRADWECIEAHILCPNCYQLLQQFYVGEAIPAVVVSEPSSTRPEQTQSG